MGENRKLIKSHTQLDVYRKAFDTAMKIFELSKQFPTEERFSLTDQIRRSSRSVCSNMAEGWRRRRYPAAFKNKFNESESEAAETQTWIEFAVKSGYLDRDIAHRLYKTYEEIIGGLVKIQNQSDRWTFAKEI